MRPVRWVDAAILVLAVAVVLTTAVGLREPGRALQQQRAQASTAMAVAQAALASSCRTRRVVNDHPQMTAAELQQLNTLRVAGTRVSTLATAKSLSLTAATSRLTAHRLPRAVVILPTLALWPLLRRWPRRREQDRRDRGLCAGCGRATDLQPADAVA